MRIMPTSVARAAKRARTRSGWRPLTTGEAVVAAVVDALLLIVVVLVPMLALNVKALPWILLAQVIVAQSLVLARFGRTAGLATVSATAVAPQQGAAPGIGRALVRVLLPFLLPFQISPRRSAGQPDKDRERLLDRLSGTLTVTRRPMPEQAQPGAAGRTRTKPRRSRRSPKPAATPTVAPKVMTRGPAQDGGRHPSASPRRSRRHLCTSAPTWPARPTRAPSPAPASRQAPRQLPPPAQVLLGRASHHRWRLPHYRLPQLTLQWRQPHLRLPCPHLPSRRRPTPPRSLRQCSPPLPALRRHRCPLGPIRPLRQRRPALRSLRLRLRRAPLCRRRYRHGFNRLGSRRHPHCPQRGVLLRLQPMERTPRPPGSPAAPRMLPVIPPSSAASVVSPSSRWYPATPSASGGPVSSAPSGPSSAQPEDRQPTTI